MNDKKIDQLQIFDVIVIGAGPAGLGVSILLQELGINYTILEKDEIGASFRRWPEELNRTLTLFIQYSSYLF